MTRGSPGDGSEPLSAMDKPNNIKPRAYQQEMLAESLRQNTIVAMETGSGKTQIAVLRIQEELSRCSPKKLVWFLTPTVALAEQQYTVISKQLPIYQSRLLLGSDNVDHWSTQQIWDKILLNIRIVVSTPQVLLDAMCHGFVKLSGLSLLVFDEAHRCVKASPFNGIMRLYHHARKSGLDELPAILGLTATPATKATAEAVKLLEDNLHAICRTPVIEREELLKWTHKPELSIVTYSSQSDQTTEILKGLDDILELTLADIENDPYVKSLRAKKDDKKSQEILIKLLDSGKTFTRKEIMSLAQRAQVINAELGSWAADVFVVTCAEKFIEAAVHRSDNNIFRQWEDAEKIYMMQYLSMLPAIAKTRVWGSVPDHISQKAKSLITTIANTYNPGYRVIVFAEQRATVIMLAHLLSVHPLTKGIVTKYFLGNSNYANRKSNITELSTLVEQKDVLTELRVGKTNVLIATNVLEEGIDVPACNIVICFDPPKDLRSFIQRRGRARDRQSRLVLFIDGNDDDGLAKWESMEEKLKEIYADNMRELKEIKALEDIEEESTEILKVPSTEAVLNHQNAQPFLAHFCATVSYAHTTNQPEYIIERQEVSLGFTQITAKVVLPSYIDPSLRVAFSKSKWRTEKAAKRDAAFQAYIALYDAGMVDDNLMPIHRKKYADAVTTAQEKKPKLIEVSECWNPWNDIAQLRRDDMPLIPTRVYFNQPNPLGIPDMMLLLPTRIPSDCEFVLFWNQKITLKVKICNDRNTRLGFDSEQATRFTHDMFLAAYQNKVVPTKSDYITLFWPSGALEMPVEKWLASITGTMGPFTRHGHLFTKEQMRELGMARTSEKYSRPFFIEQIVETSTDDVEIQDADTSSNAVEPNSEPHFKGTTLPKRTDFLHQIAQSEQLPLAHTSQQLEPVRLCHIDRLPAKFSKFALFIPSITHKIEVLFIAERLARTVLSRVKFENLSHVLTAISASSAQEEHDYQRYEFLGDSLLKLITSIHLVVKKPLWHEGLLSAEKDTIVSNGRLHRTALDLGLDKFILTKSFTGRKWRPNYISQFETVTEEKRQMSTKTLADVVEALLGAAFLDGGYEKLESCAKIFLPEQTWTSISDDMRTLYEVALVSNQASSHPKLGQMEEILGYKFNKPSILFEALTHPCANDGAPTYQRLEFLGDSLLDHFVVQEFFNHPEKISHQDMHLMRTAVVNAHFLGFLCQSLYITEERSEPVSPGKAHISTISTEHKIYLWQLMRHGASWEITNAQQETKARYEAWGPAVHDALMHSNKYPWADLFRINASKFFSDMVESLLGAIFVDSKGSLDASRQFLERISLLPCLRRIIREEVLILHPFNQLHEAAISDKVQISHSVEKRLPTSPGFEDVVREDGLVFICSVKVAGEEIVRVENGVNKLEAEARAAGMAADILRARMAAA
ncbi:RNA helicase/RNAse III, putative [Talaromyces stipitatus ATCC 10500]|uniref:RNA helicase/RNAse III, putative n=1 Tax=Talaromyces stipitatus (strain ATCC 10500 / CBS 375.48 / QM 6759 / NRRL 1006) TaxID=441959 RepID=B8MLK2_TALSN|nr:RNA helicase/RNAse III, putative [Talaromyces stipitatus ATCC 10500]EED15535.1 RNA helicase/RNAse III, putative [Talaromyces stipitatus ATCC 10500]